MIKFIREISDVVSEIPTLKYMFDIENIPQSFVSLHQILAHAMNARDFIDDESQTRIKLEGFVVLKRGYVCPLYQDKDFGLSPLYVSPVTGGLHCSTIQVAGYVNAKQKLIDYAVDEYNALNKKHGITEEDQSRKIICIHIP